VREEQIQRRKKKREKKKKREEKKVGEIFKLENFWDKNKRQFMQLVKNYFCKQIGLITSK
jgi:hypothetical protein